MQRIFSAVLEGGVQRIGDRIRLNVQLIDPTTDAHLWAETYDRELSAANVFSIQSEVAEAITQALSAVLTGDERLALSEIPTSSTQAYEAYLRGVASMRGSPLLEDQQLAEAALSEAVSLDPEFAVAYFNLGNAHFGAGNLDKAEQAFNTAIEKGIDFLSLHWKLHEIHLKKGKRSQAIAELETILQMDPEHPDAKKKLKELQSSQH